MNNNREATYEEMAETFGYGNVRTWRIFRRALDKLRHAAVRLENEKGSQTESRETSDSAMLGGSADEDHQQDIDGHKTISRHALMDTVRLSMPGTAHADEKVFDDTVSTLKRLGWRACWVNGPAADEKSFPATGVSVSARLGFKPAAQMIRQAMGIPIFHRAESFIRFHCQNFCQHVPDGHCLYLSKSEIQGLAEKRMIVSFDNGRGFLRELDPDGRLVDEAPEMEISEALQFGRHAGRGGHYGMGMNFGLGAAAVFHIQQRREGAVYFNPEYQSQWGEQDRVYYRTDMPYRQGLFVEAWFYSLREYPEMAAPLPDGRGWREEILPESERDSFGGKASDSAMLGDALHETRASASPLRAAGETSPFVETNGGQGHKDTRMEYGFGFYSAAVCKTGMVGIANLYLLDEYYALRERMALWLFGLYRARPVIVNGRDVACNVSTGINNRFRQASSSVPCIFNGVETQNFASLQGASRRKTGDGALFFNRTPSLIILIIRVKTFGLMDALFNARCSPVTVHRSLFAVDRSPFTSHHSRPVGAVVRHSVARESDQAMLTQARLDYYDLKFNMPAGERDRAGKSAADHYEECLKKMRDADNAVWQATRADIAVHPESYSAWFRKLAQEA